VRVQVLLGVAAIALAVAVGVALGRRSAPRAKPPAVSMAMPEANPIADAWGAAAAGDVAAYLACFASEARAGLEARLAKSGGAMLRAEAEAALGIEWGPPQRTPDGAVSFPVTVEHKDDAERFDYEVVRVGSDWKIRAIVPRGRVAVPTPYAERLGPPPEQGEKK